MMFQVYGRVINLLTLAGLWTVFGVAGPSVTNHPGRFMETFQVCEPFENVRYSVCFFVEEVSNSPYI